MTDDALARLPFLLHMQTLVQRDSAVQTLVVHVVFLGPRLEIPARTSALLCIPVITVVFEIRTPHATQLKLARTQLHGAD